MWLKVTSEVADMTTRTIRLLSKQKEKDLSLNTAKVSEIHNNLAYKAVAFHLVCHVLAKL